LRATNRGSPIRTAIARQAPSLGYVQEPAVPDDERGRLEALRALEILDTPAEERFDRITRMAARALQVPMAMVSLLDADRQWFKSCVGLDVGETPRGVSFCGHAILDEHVFVVADARRDERFADNPFVTGDPFVRAYAGYPLRTLDGHRVGTLCVLDTAPRDFTADELTTLRDLGSWVELELGTIERDKARDSERRLMTLLASVADGVATFDLAGIVTSANAAAEAMFKHSEADMVGRPVTELVLPEDRPVVVSALLERAEAEVGTLFHREIRGLRADGSHFPMDTTVSEVVGREGELFIAIARDTTEEQDARNALTWMRERNERVLDSVGDGVIGIDRTGHVFYVNEAACEVLRRSSASLMGLRFHDVAQSAHADGSAYSWDDSPVHATLFEGTTVREYDEAFWRADGSCVAVEYVSTPLTEGTRVTGAAIVFRDVTERRAMDRMKDEFVSVVSHELRTPLTSIRGSLGLLAGGVYGELPPEASDMLDLAVDNTDRLVRLVNDILDLERLQSGRVELEIERVDLTELAAKAVAAVASATDRGVRVRVSGWQVLVDADADRIVQVITNLVGNAIKFSDPDGVVDVEASVVGDEGIVRVTDHGRGIPADLLERIFDRFQQVDASDAREKGGTGLGLAIARGIVEEHGGRIWAESVEGEGAVFSVALPRTARHA
jgi:PAS domain S-box-containing protein